MAEDEDQTTLFRKILVAVDTSSHSRAALEAAVAIAKIHKADVSGIFVHEEHWSRADKFSAASAINALTGESESLEAETLQQKVDQLTNRLRRRLERLSRRNEIRHTWRTSRGHVAEQILEAAKDADLITIGRRGRSYIQKNKLGSTAREVIRKANKPVLILKKGLRLGTTVSVVYNGTPESQKGLRIALSIARENGEKLSVLVTDSERAGSDRDKTVEKMVEDSDVSVNIKFLRQISVGRFLNVVNYQHSGLLIIPKNQSFLRGNALEITIEHIQCPVLLVT